MNQNTQTEQKHETDEGAEQLADIYTDTATYCPEDNKLRLYVGRVPRDEYLQLRKAGWTSTPKQECDFVATWSPSREDTAIDYAGYIGDEDQGPEDRAADRAERFAGYRENRRAEAHGHADAFDAGPVVHGYQNIDRAERAANRHDRQRVRAVSQWSKAEYWQYRTAAVISHALHKSSARVRRGRILKLEAELRKMEKTQAEAIGRYKLWCRVQAETDTEKAHKLAYTLANSSGGFWNYQHPRKADRKSSLYSLMTDEADPITGHEAAALVLAGYPDGGPCQPESGPSRWVNNTNLRLSYERQMLEAEGGTAAAVDIIPGGWFGKHQVQKVHRSPLTKLVVSVSFEVPYEYHRGEGPAPLVLRKFNIQRLGEDAYRAPTAEELPEFAAAEKIRKAETKKKNAGNPKLINPTPDDAQKLQDILNARAQKTAEKSAGKNASKDLDPSKVRLMTQAEYSARSKGTYAHYEAQYLTEKHTLHSNRHGYGIGGCRMGGKVFVCKVRTGPGTSTSSGYGFYRADSVIVITDKPQKPLPWETIQAIDASHPSVAELVPQLRGMCEAWGKAGGWWDRISEDLQKLLQEAEYRGLMSIRSQTQVQLTQKGADLLKEYETIEQPEGVTV